MENNIISFNIKHIKISLIGGMALGAIISGLSTALYFAYHDQNRSPNVQPPILSAPGLTATASAANKPNTPLPVSNTSPTANYIQQQHPEAFLKPNVPFFVPAETPKDHVLDVFYKNIKLMPSIPVGTGKKEIYVLFDPLCSHCHKSYDLLINNGLAKKYDVTAHFIPARVFYSQAASMATGLYMNDLVIQNDMEGAKRYLESIMNKKPLPLPDGWKPSETAIKYLDLATMALLQFEAGTPLTLWTSSKDDRLHLIPGEIDEEFLMGLK